MGQSPGKKEMHLVNQEAELRYKNETENPLLSLMPVRDPTIKDVQQLSTHTSEQPEALHKHVLHRPRQQRHNLFDYQTVAGPS